VGTFPYFYRKGNHLYSDIPADQPNEIKLNTDRKTPRGYRSLIRQVTVSRGVLLFYLKDSSDTSDHFLIHFVLSTNRNTASITNRITT